MAERPNGSRIKSDIAHSDTLIPPDVLEAFLQKGVFSEAAVVRFASQIGIAPGIVVGRLQRDEKLHHSELLHLKKNITP